MIEAVLQTGADETPYRRAGRGTPVLLLVEDGGPGADGDTGPWLFRVLSARHRVIAPVRPRETGPDGRDPADRFHLWLRGLIDGLGLDQPAVVAAAADGGALLAFAAIDPHRLRRVALVRALEAAATPAPAGVPLDDATDATIAAAAHPVLRLTVPPAADAAGRQAAEDALIRFLERP